MGFIGKTQKVLRVYRDGKNKIHKEVGDVIKLTKVAAKICVKKVKILTSTSRVAEKLREMSEETASQGLATKAKLLRENFLTQKLVDF